MVVPISSAQSWRAAFTGTYDDGELDVLAPFVLPGAFVIDIGACLGFYTIPLAAMARPLGAYVVAVEPVPANCDILRSNLELNDLAGHVAVLPLALGRAEGHLDMHVEPGGRGNATIVSGMPATEIERHDPRGRGAPERVAVSTLDDVELPDAVAGRRCTLLKIDVEGFELDVLDGGEAFIAKHRPVIFAEFHPQWLRSRGVAPTAPHEWAASHGYRCAEVVRSRANALTEQTRVTVCELEPGSVRSGSNLLLIP
jgi:FkbM family methyltransferase